MKDRFVLLLLMLTGLFILPLNARAQYTRNSIYTDARAGNYAAVEKFLQNGANQGTLNNLLGAAVTGQQLKIIELLVQRGADPNSLTSYNSHLLHNAIMMDFPRAAAKLVTVGADPNKYGYKRRERTVFIDWDWTPLMCAAFKGQKDLVELLLEQGADPTLVGRSTSAVDTESAADIAAYSGHLDTLKLLLKQGAPLSRETIFKTVRGGHLNVLRYLLKHEKDLNRLSRNQTTLLMEAAWWGRPDIVKYLLRKGADVNFRNPSGQTALLALLSNPDRELKIQLAILKRLIRNGAAVGQDLTTAKKLAQKHNKKPILVFLNEIEGKE